jgi:clan AA aspartic protease (TIGR02281 family)
LSHSRPLHWAIAWLAVCGAGTALGSVLFDHVRFPRAAVAPPASDRHAPAARRDNRPPPNVAVFPADPSGHFFVDAEVNGAAVRFLVDTGASVVALAPQDAEAAGLAPGQLRFSTPIQTANGVAHAAPVTLREIRLGQMSEDEVPAVVLDVATPYSLLGMSFLRRLERYEIEDRELRLYW